MTFRLLRKKLVTNNIITLFLFRKGIFRTVRRKI